MLRFLADLSILFLEYSFLERFDRTAQSGFRGIKFMFPYDYDIDVLKKELQNNQLGHALHNLPAGDWTTGRRSIACIPGREEGFRDGAATAIRYAKGLGNKKISCLMGKTPTGFFAEQIQQTLVENLRYAANMLAKEDILLLIELINHFGIPSFHLTGARQVLALIDGVGCSNIKTQYDICHMQRMEGELTQTMATWANKIGHLQITDNPRRGEPGTRGINYDFIFKFIDRSDYDGQAGCEYKPLATTEAGLTWINQYRQFVRISDITIFSTLSEEVCVA